MTQYKLFMGVGALITCGAVAGLIQTPKNIDAQNRGTADEVANRSAFQKIRGQLEVKEVPFDPDILLEPTWREEVGRVLDQIPEMRERRFLGGTIKGVQMAETLYLPEKVRLTGDTLLLAKNIIFEGNNVLIKGNYNVYFMPLEMDGALGTSLELAMRESLGRQARPDVADMVPEQRRGTAYGLYNLAFGITVFPASLLFGLVWNQFGAPTAFLSSACVSFVAILLLTTVRSDKSIDTPDL